MKVLLLGLPLLLAHTNVTIAKSTLNDIARGRNVSESPGLSPNEESTARILKQDTTSRTSNQAENAEERGFLSNFVNKLASQVEHYTNVRKYVAQLSSKKITPEDLFLELSIVEEDLFKSPSFKAWFHAVQNTYPQTAGDDIIKVLLKQIVKDEENVVPLALMLYDAKTATPPNEMAVKTYEYLLSYWVKKTDPDTLFDKIAAGHRLNYMTPRRYIWVDFAKRAGMEQEYITNKQLKALPGYEKISK